MHPDGTANEAAAEGYVGPVVIPHAEERSSGITNLTTSHASCPSTVDSKMVPTQNSSDASATFVYWLLSRGSPRSLHGRNRYATFDTDLSLIRSPGPASLNVPRASLETARQRVL